MMANWASSQAAPFSFHCTICFESFHPELRYPVVLPCGHTFICSSCSKRLERCMECRTSLYITVPATPKVGQNTGATNSPSPGENGRSSARWTSYSRGPGSLDRLAAAQRAPKTEQLPLPLPKNLLLLSLMETAQQEARVTMMGSVIDRTCSDEDDGVGLMSASLSGDTADDCFSECDEDDLVRFGMRIANSTCGTYAVTCPEGLPLLRDKKPQSTVQCVGEEDRADFLFAPQGCPSSIEEEDGNDMSTLGGSLNEEDGRASQEGKDVSTVEKLIETFETNQSQGNATKESGNGGLYEHDQSQEVCISPIHRAVSPLMEQACRDTVPLHLERDIAPLGPEVIGEEAAIIPELEPNPILEFGCKVQVVCIEENGWVTLARQCGYLYIPPGPTRLVKVGPPSDQACQLEGMLHMLAERKRDVVESGERLCQAEERLNKMLDKIGSEHEESAVIKRPAAALSQTQDTRGPFRSPPLEANRSAPLMRSLTSASESPQTNRNAVLATQSFETALKMPSTARRSVLRPVRQPQGQDKKIDFRTGMSGHKALFSPTAHFHQNVKRNVIRMMGHHGGIGGSARASAAQQLRDSPSTNFLNCGQPRDEMTNPTSPCSGPILQPFSRNSAFEDITGEEDEAEFGVENAGYHDHEPTSSVFLNCGQPRLRTVQNPQWSRPIMTTFHGMSTGNLSTGDDEAFDYIQEARDSVPQFGLSS